jgi:hypothetical protein
MKDEGVFVCGTGGRNIVIGWPINVMEESMISKCCGMIFLYAKWKSSNNK